MKSRTLFDSTRMLLTLPSRLTIEPPALENVVFTPRLVGASWIESFVWPSFISRQEKIRSDNDGSVRSDKPCEHYKRWQRPVNASNGAAAVTDAHGTFPNWADATVTSPLYGYWDGRYPQWTDPLSGLDPMFIESVDQDFVPWPTNLSELQESALKSTLPLIRAELSLVNSIIELKDFVTLKHTVRGLVSNFKRTVGDNSQLFGLLVRSRAGLRTLADMYLQVKFNIQPLISDLRGIYHALVTYQKRLNALVSRRGQPQKRYYTYYWRENADAVVYGAPWVYQTSNYSLINRCSFRQKKEVLSELTVFRATISYNYNYTKYQLENARVLALLDALGVRNPLKITWNAIPWSFVVDWVAGVSRWLDNFDMSNMKPLINIRKFCWSVKRARNVHVTRLITVSSGTQEPSNERQYMMPIIHESAYRRGSGLPSISSITSSGLSLNEFSLGAALVIARRRSRGNT